MRRNKNTASLFRYSQCQEQVRRTVPTLDSRCKVEHVPTHAIVIHEVVEINSTYSLRDLSLPPLCTLHICTSEMVRIVDL